MVPRYLYRGDSDLSNIRLLRDTIINYQVQSNLISRGNGSEIKEFPIINLVNKHITNKWSNSHFLSFTEDKAIAECYGMNCNVSEHKSLIN